MSKCYTNQVKVVVIGKADDMYMLSSTSLKIMFLAHHKEKNLDILSLLRICGRKTSPYLVMPSAFLPEQDPAFPSHSRQGECTCLHDTAEAHAARFQ